MHVEEVPLLAKTTSLRCGDDHSKEHCDDPCNAFTPSSMTAPLPYSHQQLSQDKESNTAYQTWKTQGRYEGGN